MAPAYPPSGYEGKSNESGLWTGRRKSPVTSPSSLTFAKNEVWVAITSLLSQKVIRFRRWSPPASTFSPEYLPFTTSTGFDSHTSSIRAHTVNPATDAGSPFTVTSPLKITSRKPGGVIAWASAVRSSPSMIAAMEAQTKENSATPSISHAPLDRIARRPGVEDVFEVRLMPKPESVCISKPCGSSVCRSRVCATPRRSRNRPCEQSVDARLQWAA